MSSTRVDRHVNIKRKNVVYSAESNETETMGLSQGCMCDREGLAFNPNFFFPLLLDVLHEGIF